jgi:uncharacterized protein
MIEIAGEEISLGECRHLEIPVARLSTQTMMSLPVTVINGKQEGAKLWLSAAIHGDEINGVEIIRQVIQKINPQYLHGTLIAVPIVNVFGFIEQSRYLPDRRDLNRSFPGTASGSLASRLANLFMAEIVNRCTHGIDLHTAALHKINLPQIRANLEDPLTYAFAQAFNAPIIINSTTRDGSLRQAASKKGIPVLLYEGGEGLRLNREAIKVGVKGILKVMNTLEMYDFSRQIQKENISLESHQTTWIRAGRSGILHLFIKLGEKVKQKQTIGVIFDAFGATKSKVKATMTGIIIGHTQNPLINQGDAIVHLASVDQGT